jgi:Succinylglutamate desuccinylase / Aspartoacylase family
MTKIYSKALDRFLEIDRFIGQLKGSRPGPTLIFIAGIHGNEPAGVFALDKVLEELKERRIPLSGTIYAIGGNLWALEKGKRYGAEDLNRLWTGNKLRRLFEGKLEVENEDVAQFLDIYNTIKTILDTGNGPFYFMDLHTTSCKTGPFLTVNDSLLNRKFTMQYPIPIILGIEEYLDGPLLSYINELGYVAFGHESGRHDDLAAYENHVSFIYLTTVFTGCIDRDDIDYNRYYDSLSRAAGRSQDVYEICSRYKIQDGEAFMMNPGFINFQRIRKGQKLGLSDGKTVFSSRNGKILMPLYQSRGDEGFFTIRRIRSVYLHLSAVLRKMRFDRALSLLPGVRWASDKQDTLSVDGRVARFFAKQFFHLMGYRSKKIDRNYLIMKNRETASRNGDYRKAVWYKNKIE